MLVRLKIGANAGQIVDVMPLAARGLLARGNAEDPRLDEQHSIFTESQQELLQPVETPRNTLKQVATSRNKNRKGK